MSELIIPQRITHALGRVPVNSGSGSSDSPFLISPQPMSLREVTIVAGYAKSWIDKFNDGWYLSLKLHERGLWDQLFTYAKMVGDTGRITGRSWSSWGQLWGCDARTCRKIVTKMHEDCKVVLTERTNFLELEIVNYHYYQRVKKVEDNKSQAKMPQKCSLKQTRPDQTRPTSAEKPPSVQGEKKEKKKTDPDHANFVKFWHDKYRDQFNEEYHMDGGKDGELIRKLLHFARSGKEDWKTEIAGMIEMFFRTADVGPMGHTVGTFYARRHQIREEWNQ